MATSRMFIRCLRPLHHRRHGGQDRFDVAAGAQAENRATVVEQVELDITAAADELLVALGLAPGFGKVVLYQRRIDSEERQPDRLREGEIRVPVAAVEIVVE